MAQHLTLPIDAELPNALSALREHGTLVLEAEPGAGKTTRFPMALHATGFVQGLIIVVQPRRIAARMVAHFLAEELGEPVGSTIGYQVRFEKRAGPNTRILFVTEGILLRRLQGDPTLCGVGAVIVDEFHERSLALDLIVTLLRRLRKGGKQNLQLVVMSATMDGKKVATYLGTQAHLQVAGRAFPVEHHYLKVPSKARLEKEVSAAVGKALRDHTDGHVLVFLPGAGEIRRAHTACQKFKVQGSVELFDLHGSMPLKSQRLALEPSPIRKVIFSTNIAETSLTIEGVRVVIDSGLVRESRFNQQRGTSSLLVGHISQASAVQRAGRAGRTQNGACYHLFTRQAFGRMAAFDTPELLRADLTEPVLLLESLGIRMEEADFLDAPALSSIALARGLLEKLGALQNGIISELGKRMLALPLHPRLARLVVAADKFGVGGEGCLLAALLAERDILHDRDQAMESGDSDLLARKEMFELVAKDRFSERAIRGSNLNKLAVQQVRQARDQLLRFVQKKTTPTPDEALLRAMLVAYPDQVARVHVAGGRRKGERELTMVGGNRVALHTSSAVHGAQWVVALDVEERQIGTDRRTFARMVSKIEADWLLEYFETEVEAREGLEWDSARGRVDSVSQLRYGELVLEESRERPTPCHEVSALLLQEAMRKGADRFVDVGAFTSLIRRLEYAQELFPGSDYPQVSQNDIEPQLELACTGLHSLKELESVDCVARAEQGLPHNVQEILRKQFPKSMTLAGGRRLDITYEPGKPPWVQSYLQDFFGMETAPMIASGRVPLTLHLLAPNRRAVQVSADLGGFWDNHYPDLRQSLMRRYPKHAWPENPRTAMPPRPRGRRRNQK